MIPCILLSSSFSLPPQSAHTPLLSSKPNPSPTPACPLSSLSFPVHARCFLCRCRRRDSSLDPNAESVRTGRFRFREESGSGEVGGDFGRGGSRRWWSDGIRDDDFKEEFDSFDDGDDDGDAGLRNNLLAAVMAPTRIGIDLTEIPQRIGGLVMSRYIVNEGSKGLKLRGADASTTKEEVVAVLKDAVDVVKSFFGAPNFDAVVIVIPNDTKKKLQEDIISYGRGNGFNITQVIDENTAVCAAYVEKVRPQIPTNLAIISLTGGILEISVVSIVPNKYAKPDLLLPMESQKELYQFIVQAHKAHPEVIDLDESSKDQKGSGSGIIGLIGGAAKALLVDPLENALGILKNILESPNLDKTKVDKVVFVGKASRSEKVRKAVKESFSKAEVWEGIDDPDEIVAYGAAYLSYEDKEIPMYPADIST